MLVRDSHLGNERQLWCHTVAFRLLHQNRAATGRKCMPSHLVNMLAPTDWTTISETQSHGQLGNFNSSIISSCLIAVQQWVVIQHNWWHSENLLLVWHFETILTNFITSHQLPIEALIGRLYNHAHSLILQQRVTDVDVLFLLFFSKDFFKRFFLFIPQELSGSYTLHLFFCQETNFILKGFYFF